MCINYTVTNIWEWKESCGLQKPCKKTNYLEKAKVETWFLMEEDQQSCVDMSWRKGILSLAVAGSRPDSGESHEAGQFRLYSDEWMKQKYHFIGALVREEFGDGEPNR